MDITDPTTNKTNMTNDEGFVDSNMEFTILDRKIEYSDKFLESK